MSSVIGATVIWKNSMRSFEVSGGSVIIPKFSCMIVIAADTSTRIENHLMTFSMLLVGERFFPLG